LGQRIDESLTVICHIQQMCNAPSVCGSLCVLHLEADGVAEQPLVALLEVDDRDGQAQQQLRDLASDMVASADIRKPVWDSIYQLSMSGIPQNLMTWR